MLVLIHFRIVILHILGCRYIKNVPLYAEVELGEVDADLDNIVARFLMHVLQVNLETDQI